jgi:hypothetical protein
MLSNQDLVAKLLDWSNTLYVAAVVVTVLATFGIFVFGKIVTKLKDDQVQQYQKDADVRIAASHAHAAVADQHAAEANVKALEAEATAQIAKTQAETARAGSESAKAQAEQAKADAATANAEAEKSKTERVALELRVQELTRANSNQQQQITVLADDARPRTITVEQAAQISRLLAPHKGEKLMLLIHSSEFEPSNFGEQVRSVLTSSGLDVESAYLFAGSPLAGFGVALRSASDEPPLAKALAEAFAAASLPLGVMIDPPSIKGDYRFALVVGSKPHSSELIRQKSASQ